MFVSKGRVDLGITGRDQVADYEASEGNHSSSDSVGVEDNALDAEDDVFGVEEVLDLGFGSCKLQVQVPENSKITEAKDLVGARIATSFRGLTEKYFGELEQKDHESDQINGSRRLPRKLKTKIRSIGGSVETACTLGLADGIVDLVGACWSSDE